MSQALGGLDQIPFAAVKVFKNRHLPVSLGSRRLEEADAGGSHSRSVSFEIIRLKKQENAAAGLVSDAGFLLRPDSLGKQQSRSPFAGRRNNDPALVDRKSRVFNDRISERLREPLNRFVIIANQKCDFRNFHDAFPNGGGSAY